jgi:(p)ppGpp synthase/HD superfamily hydrolase
VSLDGQSIGHLEGFKINEQYLSVAPVSTTILLKAAQFAAGRHEAQRRKGGDESPYIKHPSGFAHVSAEIGGITDLETLVAAILHDTIEGTGTTPCELEDQFGRTVRKVVDGMRATGP